MNIRLRSMVEVSENGKIGEVRAIGQRKGGYSNIYLIVCKDGSKGWVEREGISRVILKAESNAQKRKSGRDDEQGVHQHRSV